MTTGLAQLVVRLNHIAHALLEAIFTQELPEISKLTVKQCVVLLSSFSVVLYGKYLLFSVFPHCTIRCVTECNSA